MTENIDISKAMVQDRQFADVETMHSLKKVTEEIQQAMDMVDNYQRKVNTITPPVVNGKPWYTFSFGKASVAEVNKVMESFSSFVQETFKMVAYSQNLQNNNDMNICRLVGLLAMAEANSYSKIMDVTSDMKNLSTEDEKSAQQLKELKETLLKSLNDNGLDKEDKEKQMSTLIDYFTLFTESKTKKIRAISLLVSDIEKKLNNYCSTQDTWVTETNKIISSWQETVENDLKNSHKSLEETVQSAALKEKKEISRSLEKFETSYKQCISKQNDKLDQSLEQQNNTRKHMEEAIAQYKLIIKNQESMISAQNETLNNQNARISSLHKYVYCALGISTITAISFLGRIVYMLSL